MLTEIALLFKKKKSVIFDCLDANREKTKNDKYLKSFLYYLYIYACLKRNAWINMNTSNENNTFCPYTFRQKTILNRYFLIITVDYIFDEHNSVYVCLENLMFSVEFRHTLTLIDVWKTMTKYFNAIQRLERQGNKKRKSKKIYRLIINKSRITMKTFQMINISF